MKSEWIALIVLVVFIAALINRFIFYITVVSSFSMYPALKPGNKLLIVRIYRLGRIRRGDILVFYAGDYGEMMIKRVIGLPGDEIELQDGIVRINQTRYDEPYVECPSNCNAAFHVPEGHYLFLGDNRADSVDSRSWAQPYIAAGNIRGKAILSVFPYHRLH
ncbi:MAG: signal peptidase I [Syntrophomonadaceae bacterium]